MPAPAVLPVLKECVAKGVGGAVAAAAVEASVAGAAAGSAGTFVVGVVLCRAFLRDAHRGSPAT